MAVKIVAGHYAGEVGTVLSPPPEGWEWYTVAVHPTWGDRVELALRGDEFERI